MRQGQQNNKRMRGRNRKGPNPLTRSYESNGPDVKVRGTALHIAEKYVQLARDAQSSGDRVQAESYLQHAEHYFRIVSAAQAQLPPGQQGFRNDSDGDDDGEDERPMGGQNPYPHLRNDQPSFGSSEPQPYVNGNGNGNGSAHGGDDSDGDDGDEQPVVTAPPQSHAPAQAQAESGEGAVQAEGGEAPREGRFRSRRRRPYRDRDRAAGEGGAAPEGPAPVESGE
jgi:hypothetical protein